MKIDYLSPNDFGPNDMTCPRMTLARHEENLTNWKHRMCELRNTLSHMLSTLSDATAAKFVAAMEESHRSGLVGIDTNLLTKVRRWDILLLCSVFLIYYTFI